MDKETRNTLDFLYKYSVEHNLEFNITLISVTNEFSADIKDKKVFIVFNQLPETDGCNYKSYQDLKETNHQEVSKRVMYIFWKQKLDRKQIAEFRDAIKNQLKNQLNQSLDRV